jgi:hypothetical protein
MTMTNPQQPQVDTREAFAGIKAAPLHLPDMLNLKPVNPQIAFRWGNRVASDGLRFQQLTYSGFQTALPTDVKNCPQMLVKDGKVIYGDLILMKIARNLYEGALLHNHNVSVKRADRLRTTDNDGNEIDRREYVNRAVAAGPPELRAKLKSFIPSQAETEGIISAQQSADAKEKK